MPVGGHRHYAGGGLGSEGIWRCPSCGEDNAGPIAEGCAICGAGKPGRHVGRDAARVPPAPPTPPTPPASERAAEPDARPGDVASDWAESHPEASVEEAYRAGYMDGARAMRRAQPAPADLPLDPQSKVARTIIAALGYFADQILSGRPPEVASGEWCSVDEVRALIAELATTGEVAHA